MPLVIAKSICQREFGREEVPQQFIDTLRCSLSVDLATSAKGNNLPKATKLLKVYATSPEGAMRIVHLMATQDGTIFLLFFRNKKDKGGANITIHNKEFRRQLHKHLDLLKESINAGRYFVLDENLLE